MAKTSQASERREGHCKRCGIMLSSHLTQFGTAKFCGSCIKELSKEIYEATTQ